MMNNFASDVLFAKQGKTHIFSVGQAGFIIKSSNGMLLGIDLYLSDCVERFEGHIGFKRLLPKILGPYDLDFDCLIATHPHFDHFDLDSVPELISNNKTVLYASVNCKKEIDRLNAENDLITYVKPEDTYVRGDFKFDFIFCDHGSLAPDAVGTVITVDNYKVLVAGDTCLRTDKIDYYLHRGPFDVMIAPINGAYGNMNEQECAELSRLLKPKLTIPCHYGMFASHGGNPGLFISAMKEKCPNNRYLLMTMGEKITL